MTDTNSTSEPNSGNGGSSGSGPFIPKSPNEALKPERVPEPPRRSKKARSQFVIFLNFVMTLIVLVSVVAVATFYYVISAYQQPGPLATNTHFVVPEGARLAQISQMLERNGIISDARVFGFMTKTYLQKENSLKAGEYEIKAGMSMKDVALLLDSGKSILYSVSMPEGLTVQQMVKRLADDPVLEGPVPNELPPEGSLRPDTYKFSRGTTRGEIIAQMRAAQEKLIDQIWAKRDPDLPIKTKQEFVTLASIVEKETGKDDERAHVASVFINRLNKGMRLQSDPTILYGLFGGAGRPADRPIMRSDIDKQTRLTPIRSRGFHRRRLPIRGAPRLRRLPTHGAQMTSILWPTGLAAMPLRQRLMSTMPMFGVGGKSNPSAAMHHPVTPWQEDHPVGRTRKSRQRVTDCYCYPQENRRRGGGAFSLRAIRPEQWPHII